MEVTVLERSQALVGNLELKRAHKWRWVIQYADVCDIDRTHFSSKSRKQNLKRTLASNKTSFKVPRNLSWYSFANQAKSLDSIKVRKLGFSKETINEQTSS